MVFRALHRQKDDVRDTNTREELDQWLEDSLDISDVRRSQQEDHIDACESGTSAREILKIESPQFDRR